ncbi:MAG: peptide/nickel transport system permease protein [Halobacteriales archaeon]|jgi:peptide/nickel transport system permease protein
MATASESDVDEAEMEGEEKPESRVGWRYTLTQLRRDATAMAGAYIIGFFGIIALVAYIDANVLSWFGNKYWLAEQFWVNPAYSSADAPILRPPVGITNTLYPNDPGTWNHVLGTDNRGRDVLVRLFYGTKIAMLVGIVATGIGMVMGTIVGAIAGYYGGYVDDVLMRAVEVLYAIPFLVLVIAFMVAFGRNLMFAMVGVGIRTIPVFARLIRSEVLSVREEDYIEAAKAAGVRDWKLIQGHIIPNSFAPVLVQATLQVGINILVIAGLSFLGFGAQPPTPSWGQMLSDSRAYMLPAPWFSVWPGLAILLSVMGFNLLGDGLRDALDPRIQNR